MNLQEYQGISHQQFPVIDMLLFGCDLFFLLIQFLKGKINRHVTMSAAMGYHLGTSLADVLSSARTPASDCAGDNWLSLICFLVFPRA